METLWDLVNLVTTMTRPGFTASALMVIPGKGTGIYIRGKFSRLIPNEGTRTNTPYEPSQVWF